MKSRRTAAIGVLLMTACAESSASPPLPPTTPNATSAASTTSPSAPPAPSARAADTAPAEVCERASNGCMHYDIAACRKTVEQRTRGPRECDPAVRAWAECGKTTMQFACDAGDLPPIGCDKELAHMESCIANARQP